MTMIKIWSIINNEMDYLKEIVPFHLEWVDSMYFLDTGSTDGSFEYLQEFATKDKRVIVEKYHISYVPDHSVEWREMKNPFPEVEVRNYALNQIEKLTQPNDWLIQLDGDEIFLPKTKKVIEQSKKSIISHSTINPVEDVNKHPIEIRSGLTLYDPHARIWKKSAGVRYMQNPAMKGKQFHCIPAKEGRHVYHSALNEFTDEIFHFHLHWMYGKKVNAYYAKLGITDRKEIWLKQKTNKLARSIK
jgi:glycosyltransferase involved in cell wall biosynthesis